MKHIFSIIILCFSLSACKSSKSIKTSDFTENYENTCPENGECNFILNQNKSLEILTEETTGQTYTNISDGEDLLVTLGYSKVFKPDAPASEIMDGNYSETIDFQIPSDIKSLHLKDKQLQDIKLLYGKHCYCGPEAGYRQIEKGEIKILKEKDILYINLSFEIEGTEVVRDHIMEIIDLK